MVLIRKSKSGREDAEFQSPFEKWAGTQLFRISKALDFMRDFCGQTCQLQSWQLLLSISNPCSKCIQQCGSRRQTDPERPIRKVFLRTSWQIKFICTCCPERTQIRAHTWTGLSLTKQYLLFPLSDAISFSHLLHSLNGATAWPTSIEFMTPE